MYMPGITEVTSRVKSRTMSNLEAKQSQLRQDIQNALLRTRTMTFPQLVRGTNLHGSDLLLFIRALHELIDHKHVLRLGDLYMRKTLMKNFAEIW